VSQCHFEAVAEKSDSPRRVILSKAKDLVLIDRSLSLFGTMLRIGFLPSVEMTKNLLPPDCDTASQERG